MSIGTATSDIVRELQIAKIAVPRIVANHSSNYIESRKLLWEFVPGMTRYRKSNDFVSSHQGLEIPDLNF